MIDDPNPPTDTSVDPTASDSSSGGAFGGFLSGVQQTATSLGGGTGIANLVTAFTGKKISAGTSGATTSNQSGSKANPSWLLYGGIGFAVLVVALLWMSMKRR